MASLKIDSYYPSWPRTVPLNIQRDFYVPTMFSWLLNFDTFFARIIAGIYITNIHIIIITMISFKTIKKSYTKFYWKYQKKYWLKDMTLCILCLLISQFFFSKDPARTKFSLWFFFLKEIWFIAGYPIQKRWLLLWLFLLALPWSSI